MNDTDRTTLAPFERFALALTHEGLALQYDILTALNIPSGEQADAAHHRRMVIALENGYVDDYLHDNLMRFESQLSKSDCDLTCDILNMFWLLGLSLERLTDEERSSLGGDLRLLKFSGFDFNNTRECRMAVYARYLVNQGKWEYFTTTFTTGEHGNSHRQLLGRYTRLLPLWTQQWRSRTDELLSLDELRSLLALLSAEH